MSILWRSEALVSAVQGRPLGAMPEGVTGISIDTRTMKRGEAFFAIKGEHFDGHDFATAAIKAGAALLVVSEAKLPAMGRVKVPMIVVPDVLAALEMAGVAARARSKGRIVAVTGSAGKTSTKEALRKALASVGKVHAAESSFNNHWGVPLTLARLPEDADFAIVEIGMNHAGEIRPLVRMVRPHIAIVTLIAAAHLGHFESIDDIARAKAEIFEGIERGGHALINRDDQRWRLLEKAAREAGVEHVWGFGEHKRATFRLVDCQLHSDSSLIRAKMAGQEMEILIGAPGRHVVQNTLAVLGAAYLAGADMAAVADAMATIRGAVGRGARHILRHGEGTITLIDESYNANPASMKAALDLLGASGKSEGGRHVAVLGDMLELGEHSAKLHAGLSSVIAKTRPDLILLVGPEMTALAAAMPEGIEARHYDTIEQLMPAVLREIRAGDTVMVKSSKALGGSRIVETLLGKLPSIEPPEDIDTDNRPAAGDN